MDQETTKTRSCVACLQDETEVTIKICDNQDVIEVYKILVQYEVNQLTLEVKEFCVKCTEMLLLIHDFMQKCLKSVDFLKTQAAFNEFNTVFIKQEIMEEENDENLVSEPQENEPECVENASESISEDESIEDSVSQREENVEVKPVINFAVIEEIKRAAKQVAKVKKPRGRPKKEPKPESLEQEIFNCAHCSKSYFNRTSLSRHIKKKHLGGSQCKYCCRIFLKKNEYEEHLKEEESKERADPKVFCCEHCGYSTTSSSSLFQHQRKYHSPEEPEKICNECGKSYKLKSHLRQHMIWNHMEKRYPCAKCDAKFAEAHHLRKHFELIHSEGARPDGMVQCKFCGDFFKATYLKKHIQGAHLKLKLYKCEQCNNAFDTWHQRYVHIKLDHENVREKCHLCDKVFVRKLSLKRHLVKIHNEGEITQRKGYIPKVRQTSSRAGRRTANPSEYPIEPKGPKKIVERQCEDCGESFNKVNDYKQHRIRMHLDEESLKKYAACQMCGDMVLKMSMPHHVMNIHVNKKDQFKCDLCEKTFKSTSTLTDHHKKFHLEIKQFKCNLCPAEFNKNLKLRHHFEKSHDIIYTPVDIQRILGLKKYERKNI
ncbi:zinc finger protein 83-like [Culicoides brevitarsis]|uniref:zinc finger protein 83-like n=1 Tax=Culicoides brevitarsis TaxID=469753 RepID=UPI00307C5570